MTGHTVQGKTAMALVAGAAAVGAGLGLLFSPKSGADTRRDIGRYAKVTQDGATRMSRTVKTRMEKAIQYGKGLVPKKANSSTPAAA